MGRRTLALALVVVAATAGCGERREPLGEIDVRYPVTVAGAGEEETVLERPPERITALDAGPAEIAVRLGAAERLVGVPAGFRGVEAPGVASPAGTVDVEAVARLEPDLLLSTPRTDPVDLARSERETGAPVYVQPASSVEAVARGAIELGFLLGEPVEARRAAGSIRREIAAVEERLAGRAPVRVFVDTGSLITVPARSLLGDLVRRAGGESVAGETPGEEPFGPCEVARLEPHLILTVATLGTTPELPSFRRCPERPAGLRRAVVPERLVTIPGPRVPQALEVVARALHPDAF